MSESELPKQPPANLTNMLILALVLGPPFLNLLGAASGLFVIALLITLVIVPITSIWQRRPCRPARLFHFLRSSAGRLVTAAFRVQ